MNTSIKESNGLKEILTRMFNQYFTKTGFTKQNNENDMSLENKKLFERW